MKIAIPTRNKQVDEHFGHCDYYTIFKVEEGIITETEKYQAPKGCGCKSNIAGILKEMGVQTMLAGNIGQGAINKIGEAGIEVLRGCEGDVEKVAMAFLKDQLKDSGETCHQHGEGHECNH